MPPEQTFNKKLDLYTFKCRNPNLWAGLNNFRRCDEKKIIAFS